MSDPNMYAYDPHPLADFLKTQSSGRDVIVNHGNISVVFERATERDREILEEIVK